VSPLGDTSSIPSVNDRAPGPAWEKAILPVHVLGMEFSVSWLPSDINVTGFNGENFGLLELDMMFSAEAMLSQCQFVWLSKPYGPVRQSSPSFYSPTTVPSVHLTTLVQSAIKSRLTFIASMQPNSSVQNFSIHCRGSLVSNGRMNVNDELERICFK